MTNLEEYYNKFNEEKRLDSRHGQVEYRVSVKYIHEYLQKDRPPKDIRILDVGAGTGRYSIPLFEEGYDVTAVELVQHNLGLLKQKKPDIKAYKGNAKKLKRCESDSFDLTLLFGPLYHLGSFEEKLQALSEAKRVTKPGGYIFAAYCMNEYSVITYAFKEKHILECMKSGMLADDFHTLFQENSLYDYVRLEDIDKLNREAGLIREKIFSPDGAANYIRPFLNALTDEEYEMFVKYQMSVCERADLLGAGAHVVDILKKYSDTK